MGDSYAREKLRLAVDSLVGAGSVQERLYWAMLSLMHPREENLRDRDERKLFLEIRERLQERPAAETDFVDIDDIEATKIARQIFQLYESQVISLERNDLMNALLRDQESEG